jgi:diguanylate cyclase (GGDEF)-like protein
MMPKIAREGRLTSKLFLIFLLFALLPTTILATFAVNHLVGETRRQAIASLDYQVEVFSHEIFNRLEATHQRFNDSQYTTIEGITVHSLTAEDSPFHTATPAQRQHLLAGNTQLSSRQQTSELPVVHMLKTIEGEDSDARIASLSLHEAVLFGEPDTWDLSVESCIFDHAGRLLYATRAANCRMALPRGQGMRKHRGNHEFNVNGTDFVASYRSLFLKQKYGVESWWLVISKPSEDIFSASRLFQSNFLTLAMLVILVLALLSIFLIRRQMAPLPPIMAAIKRVSARDYSHPVEVSSGDEFEDLATAFNSMSTQVSRQLRTQTSLSNIDRLILSRIKKEDIVDIVLEKTGEVLPSDRICMLMMEGDRMARIYRHADDTTGPDNADTFNLKAEEMRLASRASSFLLNQDQEQLPRWLQKLAMFECRFLQILPIKLDEQVIAFICLGFVNKPDLTPDQMEIADTYTNRIAVALSNAEWEDRLYHQAHYDSLTGLPNRPSMIDRLRQNIERAKRDGLSFAVMFLDLDDFKLINDSMGHNTGDALIKTLGERLTHTLRAEDTVARLGGDEFVIISRCCPSHDDAADMARRMATKVLGAINESMLINDHEIRASGSVGISLYPRDGEDSEELLKNADTAMYHSKGLRQGQYQFYSEELNAESMALVQLATDINNALDNDEFELYFQPKVRLSDYDIIGGEALIRWNHPGNGLTMPGDFISKAEKLGLINRIGDWALRKTCEHLARWKQYNENIRVSVNISALEMRDFDLHERIEELLCYYQLPGKMLELEITEGVLLEDIHKITASLQAIRALGVQVSIDDYGTGYSSLSYMKQLPADTIKIDRDFIVDLAHDKADQAIVHSTVTLAHDLGMKVIAEGVDCRAQLELLHRFNCDEIQGFYFSHPVKAEDFQHMLRHGLPRISSA